MKLRVGVVVGLWLCGCAGGSGPSDAIDTDPDAVARLLSDCDPLDPSVCALPFPSSHFLDPDETTTTGWRVAYGPESLPINRDDVRVDPYWWNQRDGYSINSAMIFYFENAARDGTIHQDDIGAYLADDAKTVIIDAETGERVPHWFELDDTAPSAEESDIQRHVMVSVLRPAVPYEWNRRYVVGIRGLVDDEGNKIPASEAFASLRDGTESDNQDVTLRRAHFESKVFPLLEAQGFSQGDLQLAWDFRTASRDNTLGSMIHMRDDALERAGEDGPAYTITEVEDHECGDDQVIARDIRGTFVAPNYTTEDAPSTFLNLDEDGNPFPSTERNVQFLMRVPCSVAEGADGSGPVARSAPILQYGHGLLGDLGEGKAGWLAEMANDHGWIVLSQTWTGFGTADSVGVSLMVALDPSDFAFITHRSQQGMAEFVLGMRMMQGPIAEDDALTFQGVHVMDPERRYYYGNSQGGIMGSAYMAMSPDIERGVLGVGGGPYSLLLPRSKDFDPFYLVFKEKFLDHREISLFVIGLTQQVWDPVEPGGWVWDINRDTDDPKQVLLQVAVKDNQVTTLGAHYQARAYGARTIAPQTRPIWGLEEAEGDWEGSALVEFLYTDLPDEPSLAVPPEGPDPHECPRREPMGQLQLRDFLEEGVVRHYCDGPCVSVSTDVCR